MERLLDEGEFEWKSIWEVTIWDKKFNAVSRDKQREVIKYSYLLAAELLKIKQEEGEVFLLSTGVKKGWTTEELAGDNITEGEVVAIPWGKSRPLKEVLKYYKGRFVTSDNRIATSNDTDRLLNKFLYYWLLNQSMVIDRFYRGSGIQHPNMASILEMKIPIPPLKIQAEVVRILDAFTQLTSDLISELEIELKARKIQYSYYRDEMLTFDESEVEWKTLGDLCVIGDGLHGTPKYDDSGDYFFINGNNLNDGIIVYNARTKKVDDSMFEKHGIGFTVKDTVFLSINGTVGNVSMYNDEKIVLGKSVAYFNIKSAELYSKYLFYFLQTSFSKEYFETKKTGSTIKNLGLKALRTFQIPIPTLIEQERITLILEHFDILTTSITEELNREIELRQKQYEYYRNMLLSFPKEEVDA
jgi:type I restriction enzyme S subunit